MSTDSAALPSPSSAHEGGKALHISLWIVQGLLAVAFGMAGLMKLTQPVAALAQKMAWVNDMPHLVRFIGASELLGAIGVILPAATRIKAWLTPLAAAGLTTVMILAVGFHILQGEAEHMGPALVLGLLAAFVAWGRFTKAPIHDR